jgi:hypothetical protein
VATDIIQLCCWTIGDWWSDADIRKDLRKNSTSRSEQREVKKAQLLSSGQANLYALGTTYYFLNRLPTACDMLGVEPEETLRQLVRLTLARLKAGSVTAADAAVEGVAELVATGFSEGTDGASMFAAYARFTEATWSGMPTMATVFVCNKLTALGIATTQVGDAVPWL